VQPPAPRSLTAVCNATVKYKHTDLWTVMVRRIFLRLLLGFSQQRFEFKHLDDIDAEELSSTTS
jgi:hypothetical protein